MLGFLDERCYLLLLSVLETRPKFSVTGILAEILRSFEQFGVVICFFADECLGRGWIFQGANFFSLCFEVI